MFLVDSAATHLDTKANKLMALSHTINVVTVQVPGFPIEAARAWAVGYKTPEEQTGVLIYLHYPESNQRVIYRHDPPAFPSDQFQSVFDEAEDFLASMGFMVDRVPLQNADARELWQRTPVFHKNIDRFGKPAAAPPATQTQADPAAVDEPSAEVPAPQPAETSHLAPSVARLLLSL